MGPGSGMKSGRVGNGPSKAAWQQSRLAIERNQLKLLLTGKRISARLRILDGFLSEQVKFELVPPLEIRSVFEQLVEHPELGDKAQAALKKLPPPLPSAEEAVKVEKVEDSGPVIEILLSLRISEGESGVLDGGEINEPNLGGICAASGRKKNEDAALLRNDDGAFSLMVADGMGGHAGGAVASTIAIKETDDGVALLKDRQKLSPKKIFSAAHEAILNKKSVKPKLEQMGTTAVAAFIDGSRARIVNVGDTRAFLLRENNLILLTQDDGSLPGMYEAETKKELKHPLNQKQTKDYFDYSQQKKDTNFDILYRALGREQDKDINVKDPIQELRGSALELKEGDMLILLSDGGYKYFKDFEDFYGVILANAGKNPIEIAQALEAAAKERMSKKGGDNVTALIYKHEARSEPSDSMIIAGESLSDSDLKEALEEDATSIWQRTSTAINEAQEQMERLATSVFASSEQSGIEKAQDKDEIGRLKDEFRTLQKRFVNLKKTLDEFSVKAVERYKEVEAKLEKTKPDLELVPLLDLLSGTPEQKRAILESIQLGEIEIPAEKEAGAIEIVSRAWRFDRDLEEEARPTIDFINIKVEEEGEE